MTSQRHKIPVHLETPDTLFLNMTARQSIIIGISLALSYIVISGVLRNAILLVLAIVLSVLIFASALLTAFVKAKNRSIDAWAVVFVSYWLIPKRYTWRPMAPDAATTTGPTDERKTEQVSEEEESD